MTTPDTLPECKRRLDALLPEQDAAVFGANNGLKAGTWERAFVEAIAVAHNAVDALAASELRLAEAERARRTAEVAAGVYRNSDAALRERLAEADTEMALWRNLAWMSDPSPERYGDDGEMQAGGIDYLRLSVDDIVRLRMERGMRTLLGLAHDAANETMTVAEANESVRRRLAEAEEKCRRLEARLRGADTT